MNSTSLNGCCNARYFYNLGGAHGVRSIKDYSEFLKCFANMGTSPVNICITNQGQKKTNKFLEQMGWTNTKTSGLNVWTISYADIEKALKPIREQVRLEAQERERQRQAQQAEMRRQATEGARVALAEFKKSFSGEFTTQDIRHLRGCPLGPNEIFKEITGLTTKCGYSDLRDYTDAQLRTIYNNAIKRQQNATSA
jgi:hypothetical protein